MHAGHKALNPIGALVFVVLLGYVGTGCGGDPGRDVVPMASPLQGDAQASSGEEILPLEQVRKSQAAAVSQRVANTEITVTYSRPVARGRDLFGALVPYDVVWNPGADQATTVAVTRDVTIDGQPLPAGKYSVWAIPGPDRWTVIFSSQADVYHTPYPGEAHDVLRLETPASEGPHAEALTFAFPEVEGKSATLSLSWGTTSLRLRIDVP